eukprot:3057067-Rhodomonas_salina.11
MLQPGVSLGCAFVCVCAEGASGADRAGAAAAARKLLHAVGRQGPIGGGARSVRLCPPRPQRPHWSGAGTHFVPRSS